MVAVLGSMIFSGAFVTACAVIVGMIVPQWQRIARLAAGHTEQAFAPLAQLAVAERRIAVRRWSAERRPVAEFSRVRAVA